MPLYNIVHGDELCLKKSVLRCARNVHMQFSNRPLNRPRCAGMFGENLYREPQLRSLLFPIAATHRSRTGRQAQQTRYVDVSSYFRS